MDKAIVIERLEKIVGSPRLASGSRSFIDSLLAQAKSAKGLSDKQLTYVEKYWEICNPPQEKLDSEKAWEANFTDEMRENTRIMGTFFEKHYPGSFLARNYDNPSWVPEESLYKKNVDSDWSKRIISNYKSEYKFNPGDFVVFRDTAKNKSMFRAFMGAQILIVDCEKKIDRDYANFYSVIDPSKMEDQRTVLVREDALKIQREKKVKDG